MSPGTESSLKTQHMPTLHETLQMCLMKSRHIHAGWSGLNGADTLHKPQHKVTVEKMRAILYSTRNCDPKETPSNRPRAVSCVPAAAC